MPAVIAIALPLLGVAKVRGDVTKKLFATFTLPLSVVTPVPLAIKWARAIVLPIDWLNVVAPLPFEMVKPCVLAVVPLT